MPAALLLAAACDVQFGTQATCRAEPFTDRGGELDRVHHVDVEIGVAGERTQLLPVRRVDRQTLAEADSAVQPSHTTLVRLTENRTVVQCSSDSLSVVRVHVAKGAGARRLLEVATVHELPIVIRSIGTPVQDTLRPGVDSLVMRW